MKKLFHSKGVKTLTKKEQEDIKGGFFTSVCGKPIPCPIDYEPICDLNTNNWTCVPNTFNF
jgi:hypothetical protein